MCQVSFGPPCIFRMDWKDQKIFFFFFFFKKKKKKIQRKLPKVCTESGIANQISITAVFRFKLWQ